ncbi:tRNA/rRNA methyltransferase [Williamwhitmania taraxaci]|uniref:tRNA (cytidine/uridine-2'-O-)-methyltransferase TrmJ n=1 Tax=Williamwhitmania taraxaci TaxID=1640674 RepID=A0A1G6N730_9BACT|nr:tRNA/rRNA methyltransferase [Williamwhitmania taraxaci]SDC63244.1 tRNA/rRNA methyltransferase [Williamwhitmania taraxaci]
MEITFILVEPAREENIGAAARAMKTMGFNNLRLVNPGNYLGERALATAHASTEILEQAVVFSTLNDAISDIDFVVGSAAKHRNVKDDSHWVGDLPRILSEKGASVSSVAVVFGCEESGLSNEDLALCHIVSTIPMRSKYPSLNLGQAVMVYAYELSKINLLYSRKKEHKVTEAEYAVVRQRLTNILTDVGMEPKIQDRIVDRFALLGEEDISLFHRFFQKYSKPKS